VRYEKFKKKVHRHWDAVIYVGYDIVRNSGEKSRGCGKEIGFDHGGVHRRHGTCGQFS
jgi:hypothetical protein